MGVAVWTLAMRSTPRRLAADVLDQIAGGQAIWVTREPGGYDLIKQGNIGNCAWCSTANAILTAPDPAYMEYFTGKVVRETGPNQFDVTLKTSLGQDSIKIDLDRGVGTLSLSRDYTVPQHGTLMGNYGELDRMARPETGDARGRAFTFAPAVSSSAGLLPEGHSAYSRTGPFNPGVDGGTSLTRPFYNAGFNVAELDPITAATVREDHGAAVTYRTATEVSPEGRAAGLLQEHAYTGSGLVSSPEGDPLFVKVINTHKPNMELHVPAQVAAKDFKQAVVGLVPDPNVTDGPGPWHEARKAEERNLSLVRATEPIGRGTFLESVVPYAKGAGGALGVAGLATGFVGALSKDGILPASYGQAVEGINHALGAAYAPFSPTQNVFPDFVLQKTGSDTAALAAGVTEGFGGYGAARLLAGLPGSALLAGIAATKFVADYVAYKSDYAKASQAAVDGLSALGIDTGPRTFGRDLAAAFRSETSGFFTNLPETQRALSNFAQLYQSGVASGGDFGLASAYGFGDDDAAARDRLIALKDVSLQSARDPSVAGGAVYFPDGTHGEYVDSAYGTAFGVLEQRGYDSEYLGERNVGEVLSMYDAERNVDTLDMMGNARAGYDAYDPSADRGSSEFPDVAYTPDDAPAERGEAIDDGSASAPDGSTSEEIYVPDEEEAPFEE